MTIRRLMTTLNLILACPLLVATVSSAGGEDVVTAAKPAKDIAKPRAVVGAYYFDGWAGNSTRWHDDPAWMKLNPPTHLTKRMIEEFADREPIWGWRDDKLEIMERQIDLAADNGIAFFAFCWYWNNDPKKLAEDPKHVGLNLFLKARNNHRLKFCLLVANHQGYLFQGAGRVEKGRRKLAAVLQASTARYGGRQAARGHLQRGQCEQGGVGPGPGGGTQGWIAGRGHRRMR